MTDLGQSLKVTQEAIKEYFLPQVVVYATENAKKFCERRFHLSPAEFLSPLLVLKSGNTQKVYQNQTGGNTEYSINESINIERIKTIDFEEWTPFNEETFKSRLGFYLQRGTPDQQTIENLSMNDMNDVLQVYGQSTLKESFRAFLLSIGGEYEFDFFNKCLGVVIVTTLEDDQSEVKKNLLQVKGQSERLREMLGGDVDPGKDQMISNLILIDKNSIPPDINSKKQNNDFQAHNSVTESFSINIPLGDDNRWEEIANQRILGLGNSNNGANNSIYLETPKPNLQMTESMTASMDKKLPSNAFRFCEHLQDKAFFKPASQEKDSAANASTWGEPGDELPPATLSDLTNISNNMQQFFFDLFLKRLKNTWRNCIEKKKSLKKGFFIISFFRNKDESIKTDKSGSSR
jgi:hypothetical protein